jgi:hypothetical protein
LFWDIASSRIPGALVESDDWAIVRIFEYGSLSDIQEVIDLYGEGKVRKVLSTEKLRPMAASMAFLFLDIDRYGNFTSH